MSPEKPQVRRGFLGRVQRQRSPPDQVHAYLAAVAGNLAIVVLWAVSRTSGLPAGPEQWEPEAVHGVDLLASAEEVVLAFAATRLWGVPPPSGR